MYQQVIKFEFWIYRQVLQLTYYISERNTNLFGTHCVLENVPDHFLRIDYIFWTQFSMQIQTSSHLDSDWTCKFGTMFWRTMKLHSERRHIHFAPLSWFVHSYSFSINNQCNWNFFIDRMFQNFCHYFLTHYYFLTFYHYFSLACHLWHDFSSLDRLELKYTFLSSISAF